MRLGGDTGEIGGELEGIVWEEMGRMGVQGAGRPQARRRSRRHGRSPCVSTQSKRPAAGGGYRKALPCMGKRISKTPKRPRSDVP